MHTRTTADYSPLRGPVMDDNGRDMMKLIENTPQPKDVRRKTWAERMQEKTGKQFVH